MGDPPFQPLSAVPACLQQLYPRDALFHGASQLLCLYPSTLTLTYNSGFVVMLDAVFSLALKLQREILFYCSVKSSVFSHKCRNNVKGKVTSVEHWCFLNILSTTEECVKWDHFILKSIQPHPESATLILEERLIYSVHTKYTTILHSVYVCVLQKRFVYGSKKKWNVVCMKVRLLHLWFSAWENLWKKVIPVMITLLEQQQEKRSCL